MPAVDENAVRTVLQQLRDGQIDVDAGLHRLKTLPFSQSFTDLGFARVDHHRSLRQGLPEVIFAPPKTADQIVAIARELREHHSNVLITRLAPDVASVVCDAVEGLVYDEPSRTAFLEVIAVERRFERVVIVTAGTGDMAVAEEAAQTLRTVGIEPTRVHDAGVAGIHRLLASVDVLMDAHVVVVVAGMEGALASVVGGLVSCPVIAVPTSVGYGAHLGGLTPSL